MLITIILIAIFVPACVMLVFSVLKKSKDKQNKKMSDENFAVTIPSAVIMIGIMCSLVTAMVMLGFTFLSNERPHFIFYAFFGMMFWVGMYLIIKTVTFKVIIKKDQITVFSALKKTYTFSFSEIVSVVRQVKKNQLKSERLVIKTAAGKKLIVESLEISYERFANKIQLQVKNECLVGFE